MKYFHKNHHFHFFSYNVKKFYLVCQRCFCLSICRYITLLYIDSYIPFYKRWSMNSQQIHRPSRGKGQYLLDCDKGQTEHLSSMSSLWRTMRLSRWMTPTSTTVLIRPILNLFSANCFALFFNDEDVQTVRIDLRPVQVRHRLVSLTQQDDLSPLH